MRRDESLLDSMTKSSFDMSIQKVDQTHYHLSIELPENLPEEAYPLRINQSFHMYKAKQPDSAVYSWSDAGYYLNDKVVLGNSEKGISEFNIRFEALDLLPIQSENILSATYTISEISGSTEPAIVTMYPIVSEWCSINTRWNNKPQKTEKYVHSLEITESGDYTFDITQLLRLWVSNKGQETDYIVRHGFVLVNETPGIPKVFATADNGTFTTCLIMHLKAWEEYK